MDWELRSQHLTSGYIPVAVALVLYFVYMDVKRGFNVKRNIIKPLLAGGIILLLLVFGLVKNGNSHSKEDTIRGDEERIDKVELDICEVVSVDAEKVLLVNPEGIEYLIEVDPDAEFKVGNVYWVNYLESNKREATDGRYWIVPESIFVSSDAETVIIK